jgi:hypothetical protein
MDFISLLVLLGCTVLPAVVILFVVVKRDRSRGRIRPQRITKGEKRRD